MGLPSGVQQRTAQVTRYGVVLAVSPTSDPAFRTQVRVALGSSTGTFSLLPDVGGPLGPGQYPTLVDVLPNDGQYRVYQSRAARDGYSSTQAWGHTVKVKPAQLPEGFTQSTPMTGHSVTANFSISTAQLMQFGSANVGTNYKRTLMLGPGAFVPFSSTIPFGQRDANSIRPNSTIASTSLYVAAAPLPPGATVYRLRLCSNNRSSGSTSNLTQRAVYYDTSTGGSPSTAGSVKGMSTVAGHITIGSSFSKMVTTNSTPVVILYLRSHKAATPNGVGVRWVAVDYQVPTLQRSL